MLGVRAVIQSALRIGKQRGHSLKSNPTSIVLRIFQRERLYVPSQSTETTEKEHGHTEGGRLRVEKEEGKHTTFWFGAGCRGTWGAGNNTDSTAADHPDQRRNLIRSIDPCWIELSPFSLNSP